MFTNVASVDGGWGPWSEFSLCSAPCGPGTKERKRSCDNPAPKEGGRQCKGVSKQVADCSYRPCPGIELNFNCASQIWLLLVRTSLLSLTSYTIGFMLLFCHILCTLNFFLVFNLLAMV